ncbi:TPA: hypothetical protein N3A45_003368 [Salmonella enterica subsp. salamae serovar [1],40:z35:e,n,x,z15]|nr:hypothetical protein [Salmonella enterica]HCM2000231.1 hypothetical protein [Salmonella enterica subsp. salamae serovar [1],40:z35:e,n,x,z15]
MREEKNIKNNLAYYLVNLTHASFALSVIWEGREPENYIDNKTQAAISFILREIYDRYMALDAFLENENLTEFMSDRDIYALLAEQQKNDSQ